MVYTTWSSVDEAKRAGKRLLKKRLCGCVNIFPEVMPLYWWPPKSEKIEQAHEVVMIIKTLKSRFNELESEIYKIHTFDTPCIVALPVYKVGGNYFKWIKGEIEYKSKIKKPTG